MSSPIAIFVVLFVVGVRCEFSLSFSLQGRSEVLQQQIVVPQHYRKLAEPFETPLSEFNTKCRKQLWMIGLEAKTNSQFLWEHSSIYVENLLIALRSAQVMAPSLFPVVCLLGTPEDYAHASDLLARIEKHGGKVIFHELSFAEVLRDREIAHGASTALATYLKVDLPLLVEKALPLTDGKVETEYVLWTDPDVIFYKDLNSCTLPRPLIMSIAGDTGHENPASFGVVYYNVTAYTMYYKEVLAIGQSNAFGTEWGELDQGFLRSIFRGKLNLLPDVYNYKPYWGRFPKAPVDATGDVELFILHMQGPKLKRALCVLGYLKQQKPEWAIGNMAVEGLRNCGAENAGRFGWIASLLAHSYNIDKGSMYYDVAKTYETYLQEIQ